MKRIVWASRHPMTSSQVEALGLPNCVSWLKDFHSVDEILEFAEQSKADMLAVVLPIDMLEELLNRTKLPVLRARTRREFNEDGSKKEFVFDGWEQVLSVEVFTVDYG